MDSSTLGLKHPTLAEASTTVAPEIHYDVIDEILDHLSADSNFRLILLTCSLISKSWVTPCRRRFFHTIAFTGRNMATWLKTFPIQEESPAHYTKGLSLSLGGCHAAPEEFFRRTQWFTNVKKLTVFGTQGLQPVWIPSFGRLPKSVTSLTIDTDIATLLEIRDLMVQLPNLNDLTLSGSLHGMDKGRLRGIGTVLKGEFGGQLRLFRLRRNADPDVMNMLLEIPTGLHFSEVCIACVYDCLPSTVKLAEACGKNLVKLTYSVEDYDGREILDRSFNFAKLPNLKEVKLTITWTAGDLLWVSAALSTIKPPTSPHLSLIQLTFCGRRLQNVPENPRERLINDLLLIEREVARVEHEFMGTVTLSVTRYPGFEQ